MKSNTYNFYEGQKVNVSTIKALKSKIQEVEFDRCKIQPGEWRLILQALSEKPQLTKLKIFQYWIQFTEDQIKAISFIENLEELQLSGICKEDFWFSHICSLEKLKQLMLKGNHTNRINIGQIEQIHKLTNLTKLTFSDCNIDAKTAQAISNLPSLTELDLNENSIGNEGCRVLAKIKSLTSLKLSRSGITDIGAASLSQLINLQKLQLGWNYIGSAGVAHLTKLKNLRILILHQCDIRDDSAKILSKMLNLRQLWLANNPIGAEGVSALCRMTNLERLDLSNNKPNHAFCNIGNEGVCEIRKLTKLNVAYLYQSNLDSNGVYFIERMINLKAAVIGNKILNEGGNQVISAEFSKIRRRLPKVSIND